MTQRQVAFAMLTGSFLTFCGAFWHFLKVVPPTRDEIVSMLPHRDSMSYLMSAGFGAMIGFNVAFIVFLQYMPLIIPPSTVARGNVVPSVPASTQSTQNLKSDMLMRNS